MKSKGPYYTPELGKAVAAMARPKSNPTIHVIPENGRWTVFASGNLRAIRVKVSKQEAIRIARKAATRKQSNRIAIHNKNADVEREINL